MSWQLTVLAVPRADFDAAVDAAVPTGTTDAPNFPPVLETVRQTMKIFASETKRARVQANAVGHILKDNEGPEFSDFLQVVVSGLNDY